MLLIWVHDIYVVILFTPYMFQLACVLALKLRLLPELPLGGAIGTGTKLAVFSLIS